MKIWNIDASGPDDGDLEAIAALLREGGVLILPTDTVYGFHAAATDEAAVARIAALKERDRHKPMIVLIAKIDQLAILGATPSPEVRELLSRVWPAPLTAIVPRGEGTIALRMPAVAWLRRLIRLSGPLVSTSVNRTGEEPIYSTAALSAEVKVAVDGIVDAGPLRGSPSTIVDFTVDPPTTLRQGAFRFTQKLRKTLRKTL